MAFSFKKLIQSNLASAEVVDNHLILSLPHAKEPVVWRMSLEKIGTAAFEVKEDAESASAKLVLKPKKGTAEIIAPFNTKKEAVDALMSASSALQSASYTAPKSAPVNPDNNKPEVNNRFNEAPMVPSNDDKEARKWFLALFAAILVVGLYYYLTTLIPNTMVGLEDASQQSSASAPSQQSSGVPMSADDFLGGF